MQCTDDTNELWKIWEHKIPIEQNFHGTPFDLVGWSLASLRSNFISRKYKFSLDAGLSCPYDITNLFLTHGHCDHSASIFFYLLATQSEKTFYVPFEIREYIMKKILSDFYVTESKVKDSDKIKYNIVSVKPGMRILVNLAGKATRMCVFQCFHSVPTVGYGFSRMTHRQDPNLPVDLSKEEKAKLGKEGKLMEHYEDFMFVYLGDTDVRVFGGELPIYEGIKNEEDGIIFPTEKSMKAVNAWNTFFEFGFFDWVKFSIGSFFIGTGAYILSTRVKESLLYFYDTFVYDEKKVMNNHIKDARDLPGYSMGVDFAQSDIFKYKNIMVECTFVHDDHLQNARDNQHMHWRDLKPIIESHPDNNFILYHFSRRYKTSYLEKFFENKPSNCYPWISK